MVPSRFPPLRPWPFTLHCFDQRLLSRNSWESHMHYKKGRGVAGSRLACISSSTRTKTFGSFFTDTFPGCGPNTGPVLAILQCHLGFFLLGGGPFYNTKRNSFWRRSKCRTGLYSKWKFLVDMVGETWYLETTLAFGMSMENIKLAVLSWAFMKKEFSVFLYHKLCRISIW